MNQAELDAVTREDLLNLARKLGVRGRSLMNKKQLTKAVADAAKKAAGKVPLAKAVATKLPLKNPRSASKASAKPRVSTAAPKIPRAIRAGSCRRETVKTCKTILPPTNAIPPRSRKRRFLMEKKSLEVCRPEIAVVLRSS